MKRKYLLVVLTMLCALFCALGLAGCGEGRETNGNTSSDRVSGTYYLYGYTVEAASDSAQATLCGTYEYHEFIRLYDDGTFDYYWLAQYSPGSVIEGSLVEVGSLLQGIYEGSYQLSDDGGITLTFNTLNGVTGTPYDPITGTLFDGAVQLEASLFYESAYFCKEGCAPDISGQQVGVEFLSYDGTVLQSDTYSCTEQAISQPALPEREDCVGEWEVGNCFDWGDAGRKITVKAVYTSSWINEEDWECVFYLNLQNETNEIGLTYMGTERTPMLPAVFHNVDFSAGKIVSLSAPLSQTTAFVIPSALSFDNIDFTQVEWGCPPLDEHGIMSSETFLVEEGHPLYVCEDGVIYDREKTEIVYVPVFLEGKYTVPDGITHIPDGLFEGRKLLTEIVLPDSVKSIGNNAFGSCRGLKSINIPGGVTSIGASAFSGCSGLTEISIPNSVTSIERSTFSGCAGLTSITIPSNVTSIGDEAFRDCSGLTGITIPSSVTNIGSSVFLGCNLEKIDVADLAVWAECNYYPSVPWELYLNGELVTELVLSEDYFIQPQNCTSLRQVTVSPWLRVGWRMFAGCTNLERVTLMDGIVGIYSEAFSGCVSLTEIVLPDSVDGIGYKAFSGCYRLESVVLGSGISQIGSSVFEDCVSLKRIVLSENIRQISGGAFANCLSLSEIFYHGTWQAWEEVDISADNAEWSHATVYFYSEQEPPLGDGQTGYDGNYWHYDDDDVTPVIWNKNE